MIPWEFIGPLCYACGWAWSTYNIGGAMAWDFGPPGGDDYVMGLVMGAIISIAWPIALPIFYLHQHGGLGVILRPPRRIRDREKIAMEQRQQRQGQLAERYARGEIDLATFERQIEYELERTH